VKRIAAIGLCLAAVVGPFGQAGAQGNRERGGGGLPPGWSVALHGDGGELSYALDEPLPIRDARPEFREGEGVLGYPVQRGDRLVLALPAAVAHAVSEPSVWLGADRLDGPTPEVPVEVSEAPPLPTRQGRALPAEDDPGLPGPYATANYSYDVDPLPWPEFPVPLEVVADVILPVDAPGPWPLVLFLHGRHGTCYDPAGALVSGNWPCAPNELPVPSHEGYRYVAETLASRGYATVSISANAVNSQDFASDDGGAAARSALVRHHLGLLAQWAGGGDPLGGILEGAIDMDRVVLVGHSRGGEGVERAAVDTRRGAPYRLRGLVDIGPTTFGRQTGLGLPKAVILPYCDGDVSDLQGQQLVDGTRDLGEDRALRSAVLVMGTNHNFYNTEWTPGIAQAPAEDDWGFGGSFDDPTCGVNAPGRLSPAEQQAVGRTYIAALVEVALEGDRAAASLLDGTPRRAGSAGRAQVHTHALGGRRQLIYRPGRFDSLSSDGVVARTCRGYVRIAFGTASECATGVPELRLPHWLPMFFALTVPSPVALEMFWREAGASVRVPLEGPIALDQRDDIELRVAVSPAAGPVRLGLRVVDADGAVARLDDRVTLNPLPGRRAPLGKVWAYTARFDVGAAAAVDLSRVVAIELVAHSVQGRVWVLDASTRRPGLASPRVRRLPQVSAPVLRVDETDGRQVIRVPLRVRGTVRQRGALWAEVTGPTGRTDSQRIIVDPGDPPPVLQIPVAGDDVFSVAPQRWQIVIKAQRGVVTGRYLGRLVVEEDEPGPEFALSAAVNPAAEGTTVVVRGVLSQPIGAELFYDISFRPPPARTELDTDDLTEEYLLAQFGEVPDPPFPLSLLYGYLFFPAGATEATFELPLRADGSAEGEEALVAYVIDNDNPTMNGDQQVEIVVTDAP
jgi:hypothetical protein